MLKERGSQILNTEDVARQESVDWTTLQERIAEEKTRQAAQEELYLFIKKIVTNNGYKLNNSHDTEDMITKTFIEVMDAFIKNKVKHKDKIQSFIHGVIRNQFKSYYREVSVRAKRHAPLEAYDIESERRKSGLPGNEVHQAFNPELWLADKEKKERLMSVVNRLKEKDKKIILDFYFNEKDKDTIIKEMGLTETQFRLQKNRALAKIKNTLFAIKE